ncbi:MAG: hypothetical protein ACRYG8_47805 [Janthinobacterium lividum]
MIDPAARDEIGATADIGLGRDDIVLEIKGRSNLVEAADLVVGRTPGNQPVSFRPIDVGFKLRALTMHNDAEIVPGSLCIFLNQTMQLLLPPREPGIPIYTGPMITRPGPCRGRRSACNQDYHQTRRAMLPL